MCTVKAPWIMQLVVCLMLVALAQLAQASILSNGQTAPPDLLTPSGTELATNSGVITTPTFSTLFTASVFSDPTNVFCTNCLDFVYRFGNKGPDVNERFSASRFGGFMVDVGYNPSTVGQIPTTVDRSTDGNVIGFNFVGNDTVTTGEHTTVLVIETNATTFEHGLLSAQDGTAGSGMAFQPFVIPEPSSLALLGGGTLALGSFLRRFILGNRL